MTHNETRELYNLCASGECAPSPPSLEDLRRIEAIRIADRFDLTRGSEDAINLIMACIKIRQEGQTLTTRPE
jgi:hypothetical protein